MARFDFNRDGKKDIFDSMIEYEIYKDVMGEDDDDTDYTPPSGKKNKSYDAYDVLIWVVAILGSIPFFIFLLKHNINFITAGFWALAAFCVFFTLTSLTVYIPFKYLPFRNFWLYGGEETVAELKKWLLIDAGLFFIIGLFIHNVVVGL